MAQPTPDVLPKELLDRIAYDLRSKYFVEEFQPPRALLDLCLVSRKWRRLIQRPDLAACVTILDLQLRCEHDAGVYSGGMKVALGLPIEERGRAIRSLRSSTLKHNDGWDLSIPSCADVAIYAAANYQLHCPYAGNWVLALSTGCLDAAVALLLTQIPRLEQLDLDSLGPAVQG